MAKKIKAIKCPQCGSTKQKRIDEEHFECLNCGSGYLLDTDDITINHNYNYNNTSVPPAPINKKAVGIFIAILFFGFVGLMVSGMFSKKDSVATVFTNKITWQNETVSQVFTDKNNVIKLFIVGNIGSNKNSYSTTENKKLYWSVYNVSSGKTEQLNLFTDISENINLSDIALKPLNDGSLYFVFKKTKVYRYDTSQNSFVYMNNDLEQTIDKLKTGIGSIEINQSYNCLDIVSNTGAKISYFPSTKIQMQHPDNSNTMPNAVLQTKYAVSNSNPNYLIQYKAMQQSGYPAFTKPVFNITFSEKEEPIKATISNQDAEKAFVKNHTILPTKYRMHKLIVLGSNNDNVAIAYKENISEGEKYMIELLDNKGSVKWNLFTNLRLIDHSNNTLSAKNELFVTANNNFYVIGTDGKINKTINLEEITLEPKD